MNRPQWKQLLRQLSPPPSMTASTALLPVIRSPFSVDRTVLSLSPNNQFKPLSCKAQGFDDTNEHYYSRKSLKFWDKFYLRHQNKVPSFSLTFLCLLSALQHYHGLSILDLLCGCSFSRIGIIWRKIGANIFLMMRMMGKCC